MAIQQQSTKIISLSGQSLTEGQIELLKPGLLFTPTPKFDLNTVQNDLFSFFRKLRLIYHMTDVNPLSTNLSKLSNTLKQFVEKLPTNCLSMFDYFVGLALKGLMQMKLILTNLYLKPKSTWTPIFIKNKEFQNKSEIYLIFHSTTRISKIIQRTYISIRMS